MNVILALGGGGGIVALLGAAYKLVKTSVRQEDAVTDNSRAVDANTAAIERLVTKLESVDDRVKDLEAWRKYRGQK